MRTLSFVALLAVCVLVFAGCFEIETVINVKRDGSGTVRERIVLKSDMMIMMVSMAKKMKGDDDRRKKSAGLFDEQELRDKAESMGEGVRYRSSEIISGDEGEGYEAIYDFDDINTLRVSMTPDLNQSSDEGDEGEMEDDMEPEKKKEELRFEFHKGSPATLIVHVPPVDRNSGDESQDEQADEDDEQGMAMARMMLKDLRISAILEVDGKVVESDATFRDGSRIILTDIDFGKLTEDENLIRAAMKSGDVSDEEAKELMKKYPGLKIELNRKTTIRFR